MNETTINATKSTTTNGTKRKFTFIFFPHEGHVWAVKPDGLLMAFLQLGQSNSCAIYLK